ncbi:MAG: hypothetical protein ABI612_10855 [Betaproteobacteria bacterium]
MRVDAVSMNLRDVTGREVLTPGSGRPSCSVIALHVVERAASDRRAELREITAANLRKAHAIIEACQTVGKSFSQVFERAAVGASFNS